LKGGGKIIEGTRKGPYLFTKEVFGEGGNPTGETGTSPSRPGCAKKKKGREGKAIRSDEKERKTEGN